MLTKYVGGQIDIECGTFNLTWFRIMDNLLCCYGIHAILSEDGWPLPAVCGPRVPPAAESRPDTVDMNAELRRMWARRRRLFSIEIWLSNHLLGL